MSKKTKGPFVPLHIAVLTVSDTRTRENDTSGDLLQERLEAAGFFFPEAKVAGMKASLRNMWSRLGLTRAEVQTFHGMLRQIAYKLKAQEK